LSTPVGPEGETLRFKLYQRLGDMPENQDVEEFSEGNAVGEPGIASPYRHANWFRADG